jgi:hypothetical protein
MSEAEPVLNQKPKMNLAKPILSCVLAVVMAVATWGVIKSQSPFFTVGEEFNIGMGASSEARQALLSEQAKADRMNSTVALSIGGALLAGTLAIFAFECCSLPLRLLFAIPFGALAGAFSGFLGAIAYSKIIPADSFPDTTNTALAHAAVFAVFGGSIGSLFGFYGRNKNMLATTIVTGALAGAAGGLLFPIVTGVAMPQQNIVGLVQTSPAGLFWLGLPFAAIGFLVPCFATKTSSN